MAKVKMIAVGRLLHEGKMHEDGEPVAVERNQVDALLQAGVIAEPGGEGAKKRGGGKKAAGGKKQGEEAGNGDAEPGGEGA